MEQFGVNLLPDTSIYNVFKNQAKYIDNATEKLTPEVEDKVREQRGVSADDDIRYQKRVGENAIDLTDEFSLLKSGDITAEDVKNYIDGLIGQVFDTATNPLQIQITPENKTHVLDSNVKLTGNNKRRHDSALMQIEKLVSNATKTDKDGALELTHNSGKNLKRKSENVEGYVYFDSLAKIGNNYFSIELATEKIKGQDPNILNLYNVRVKKNDSAATNLIASQTGANNILSSTGKSVNLAKLDSDYMKAVESGDIETARHMVAERAKELGFDNTVPEQTDSYTLRTKEAPKRTIKAYKVFFVDETGLPSALFVNGKQTIPMNVWVDAREAFYFVDAKNGRKYVPSTLNPNSVDRRKNTGSKRYFSEKDRAELIRRGYITEKTGMINGIGQITALAYRPGWHAGDLPFFPQGGREIAGSNYENVHRWNQVVFEIEMDADFDYTEIAKAEGIEKRKIDKYADDDLQYMPEGGYYSYTTNPTVKQQTGGKGDWYIGDSIKIIRALTEEECNKILAENGLAPQEWESKENRGTFGNLDLEELGYTGPTEDAARKTLAPITYDDNGNVIPLSQRFDPAINDIRYQDSAIPLNQTIQGKVNPANVVSSFKYDTSTGKFFISGGVYNEIVEIMNSSFPIQNEDIQREVRKTATLATAFLTSLSEDTQDALVRKSTRATGNKLLTGGNENLLRLFFNMNELKDTSGVSDTTKGLSLSQSAKIILGMNSDESTVRQEGTHIIWWLDPKFRERAQNEYKKYFEKDAEGKQIRAVVEAHLDRFGGYTADQIIEGLRNLIRDGYDG